MFLLFKNVQVLIYLFWLISVTAFAPLHICYMKKDGSLDSVWTPMTRKPYHHNAAVAHLPNNLPSPDKQSKQCFQLTQSPLKILQLVWLKYYCSAGWMLIWSSHKDDWGIIVHLSTETQSWCHHSLPVAVDYSWMSRSVKIHTSHVALACFFVLAQSQAVFSVEMDNKSAHSYLNYMCKYSTWALDTHPKQILMKP